MSSVEKCILGRSLHKYSVVDIFAGPGGLAEGFSRVRSPDGSRPFRVVLSIEKDPTAHATLRLRSFLRQFESPPDEYYDFINGNCDEPKWSELYPAQWERGVEEAWLMELGQENPSIRLDDRLDEIRSDAQDRVILIGGPPCQAYSLVGRARNSGKVGYVASEDGRHFLYEEYIRILDRLRPAAFVMENVKGLLSSSVDGSARIVEQVLSDLSGSRPEGERYRLLTLAARTKGQTGLEVGVPDAREFLVRAEEFGVPQARHRVIIVGIREDIAEAVGQDVLSVRMDAAEKPTTARDVLGGMPALRSGLSKSADGPEEWRDAVLGAIGSITAIDRGKLGANDARLRDLAEAYRAKIAGRNSLPPRCAEGIGISPECPAELREWLVDPSVVNLPNNDTRGHMPADLARYFFSSLSAELCGKSPTAGMFPEELAPSHKSWSSGKFADRFRVQVWDNPSTTITCHISKDGHYFIHPDPMQCRSLTVREAARLQTFPDNYFFMGKRTAQYVQVGNAVPPLLARKIGDTLLTILQAAEGSKCAQAAAKWKSTAPDLVDAG